MESDASHSPPTLAGGYTSEWGRCSGASGTDGHRLLQPVMPAHERWSGLPMMIQILPGSAVATDMQVHHSCLAVARSGRGNRRYASGRHVRDLYSSPAMFELYAGGYCVDRADWQGVAGEVIGIQFPTPQVNRLLHAQGTGFQLPTIHELFDARVTDLVQLLWDEAREGGPRGKLYADGLSLALLGLLIEEHGASARVDTRSPTRLAPAQSARIRDYIDQHLAADLSVEQLAALLGLSAAHFSRAFKATFGASPHAYVTERRLGVACRLLQEDKSTSIADIAAGLGFSSQSHFTDAFRRKLGVTPGRWRAR